jgi:hypothetical protein
LLFLAVASPLMLVLFLVGGPTAEWTFAVLVMGYPVALIVVAVAGRVGAGRVLLAVLGLLLFLEACAVAMLLLRERVVDGPWVGGLPAAAAVQLYGLFVVPLVLVAMVYALTFDRFEMRDEDLRRLEEHRRRSGGDG